MTEVDRIRAWRDQTAAHYGPDAEADDEPSELRLSNSAWWKDVDLLLRELDEADETIKNHEDQAAELNAALRRAHASLDERRRP